MLPSIRRVLTEWLQGEAAEKGLAAAATSGAGAVVQAAAASAQLEVSCMAAADASRRPADCVNSAEANSASRRTLLLLACPGNYDTHVP